MLRAVLTRLVSVAVTLLAASLLVFVVLDLLPGNAAAVLLGTAARPDTIAVMTAALGLDRPAPERYLAWILGLLRGDFGVSAAYGVRVGQLIVERLPVTLPLAALAAGIATAIAVPLGAGAAARRGGALDRLAAGFAQLGIAVPDFWFGLLFILLFSTTLHWFAAGGFPGWSAGVGPALRALLLPAIALALPQAAVLTRVTRAAVLDVTGAPFVRTARSLGYSPAAVLWRHMMPNALVPIITVLGLQVAFLVAGAVLVENVFSLPGLGRLVTQALAQRDLAVVRGCVMVFAAVVILANGVVDLAMLRLDPRLRAS